VSVLDVITGKVPLLRRKTAQVADIESQFSALINSRPGHNYQTIPRQSLTTIQYDKLAEQTRPRFVSARYTLSPKDRLRVLDTGGKEMDVYITVPGAGTTAYISHEASRIFSISTAIHEGIPVTNNPAVAGRITANHFKWRGELWITGDTTNMIVDIEAS
jgi:hypothetical protein